MFPFYNPYNPSFLVFSGGYTDLEKSLTCVPDVLEIINFADCRTLVFFSKYAHEHSFSVS